MEIIYKTFYIKKILSNNNSQYNLRLLQLLSKFFIIEDLSNINFNNDDYSIIKYLSNNNKLKILDFSKRSDKRAKTLLNHIKNIDIKINTYLDIGCFDGSNTIEIGKILNLKKNNIIGIDIDSYAGMKIKPISNDFTFINYINSIYIPLQDNSIDFITLLQVLHHVQHPNKLLKEIKRISKNGTIIFIREHDCYNEYIENLIKLEHLLYGIIIDKTDYITYIKNIYENYFSKKSLIKKMKKYGFIEIKSSNILNVKKINPTNYYDIMFQLNK